MPPSVVIVTRDGGPMLARCVGSLAGAADVIVVVSSSEQIPPPDGVQVIHLGANLGYARAANAGLRACPPGDVLLLNDDTHAEPGFLAALGEARARHGEGLYQPRILLDDGTGRLDNEGHGLFPDGFNLARGRGQRAPAHPATEVGAASGAAVLITAGVRQAVGGFDEDLEAFGEDADLSLRAVRRGFHVYAVPTAHIHHTLGASYGRISTRKLYLVERNRVRLAIRSLPWGALLTLPAWSALRLSIIGVASMTGQGVGARVGPRGIGATLAGGVAGAAHIPGALAKRHQDAPGWMLGERAMWRHLWVHRPALRDIFTESL